MSDPAAKTTESMSRVRFKSIKNLVMAGYQGWFNTPEDGAGLGWKHFEKEKSSNWASVPLIFGRMFLNMRKPMKRLFKLPDETPAKVLVRMMLLLQICILNG